MKATKRIVSLALAALMLLSCAAFVGCEGTLGYFTERKMKEAYIETFNIQGVDANDVVLDYYAGKYSNLQIAMLDAECHDPEMWIETIGGTQIVYYDSNRLLAWDGESFMTLTEARDEGRLTSYDIASIAAKFNGDVKHFYDTGDTFDYEDKIYTEIPARFWIIHPMSDIDRKWNSKLYYRSHLTSSLTVTVDKKLSCDKDDLQKILEEKYDIIATVVRVSVKKKQIQLGI